MKFKKSLAALLAILSLTVFSTACAKETASVEGTADITEETVYAETESDTALTLKHFEKKDYSGKTLRVWTANQYNSTVFVQQAPFAEDNGEIVNDQLRMRDNLLKGYFGAEIEYKIYGAEDDAKLYNDAQKSIMAGEDTCDLILSSMNNTTIKLMNKSLICDLNAVGGIDLTQLWWNRNAVNDLCVDGKNYLGVGDITTRMVTAANLMQFNKNLFTDLGIEYPYDSVRNGTWNYDALSAIIKDSAKDLNGDGKLTTADDSWGLCIQDQFYYFAASGEHIFTTNANGIPELSCTGERCLNVIDKVYSVVSLPDVYLATSTYLIQKMFSEGRVLMLSMAACDMTLLRDMKDDFGVLPMPKYDEAQDNYYTAPNTWISTAAVIPITASDLDFAGTMIEAMCALSHYTSLQAQYETVMQIKFTRDEDSIEMLKTAVESTTYDLGSIYGWGGLELAINNAMFKGASFSSLLASAQYKAVKQMETTLEEIRKAAGN